MSSLVMALLTLHYLASDSAVSQSSMTVFHVFVVFHLIHEKFVPITTFRCNCRKFVLKTQFRFKGKFKSMNQVY